MNTTQATATMLILFALRCLVPLVLMFGIGYAMNRLVDKWEREAVEDGGTAVSEKTNKACWSVIKCDPELRENCPGFQQKLIPCWLARTRAEGMLPEECVSCPLYEAKPSFA